MISRLLDNIVSEDSREGLEEHLGVAADVLVRAPICLTKSEWDALSQMEQVALLSARERLRAEERSELAEATVKAFALVFGDLSAIANAAELQAESGDEMAADLLHLTLAAAKVAAQRGRQP